MDTPEHVEAVRQTLFKAYCLTAVPAVVLFAVWAFFGGNTVLEPPLARAVLGPLGFVGAIVFSVGLPVLVRAKFVQRYENEVSVPTEVFLVFQKTLQSVALTGAYFAAAAYMFQVSLFHLAGALLAALYGAYYYFPSASRVAGEMEVFGVREEKRQ
ncbi:hypothetical protein [Salidesulfovibrio brasiliensis]|uniref:hypothetical protein n=1 Tax=Salidesulfovibrio brasiliensis TaxID=221711 RepID=UPI0006D0F588|nr:hypothetical protein [Salidesulfovibrio brasiliensis]